MPPPPACPAILRERPSIGSSAIQGRLRVSARCGASPPRPFSSATAGDRPCLPAHRSRLRRPARRSPPARCVLRAARGRRHRRDREARQRRPDHPLEPDREPVRRHGLPGQPEAAQRPGHQGVSRASATVPEPVDLAVIVTPAATVPALIARVRRAGVPRRHRHLGRLQGDRARGRRTGAAGARRGAPRPDAPDRPQLPGRHEPAQRAQRHVRRDDGAARARSASSARAARCAPRSSTGACKEKVGFSAFVSVGSMLDVGWGDLIDYLGDDPRDRSPS